MLTGLPVVAQAVVIHELGRQVEKRSQGLLLPNELLCSSRDMKQVKNVSTLLCCMVQIINFAQLENMAIQFLCIELDIMRGGYLSG